MEEELSGSGIKSVASRIGGVLVEKIMRKGA